MSAIIIILFIGLLLGASFHIIKAYSCLFAVNKYIFTLVLLLITGVSITSISLVLKVLIIAFLSFIITAIHKANIRNKQVKTNL